MLLFRFYHPSIWVKSTPMHKRTSAIDSAAPEALRASYLHLPTSPRLPGPKILEETNTMSNFIIFLRVFISWESPWYHRFYTSPGQPCQEINSIEQHLTSQQLFFKFSHFLTLPLWNIIATKARQTHQDVGNYVQLLCHHLPTESLGKSSRIILYFPSCSSFTALSHSRPHWGGLGTTGVFVSAVWRQRL
jgi:hypothetical protein